MSEEEATTTTTEASDEESNGTLYDCEQWERVLQSALDEMAEKHDAADRTPLIRRVKVVEHASSTQDECLNYCNGENGFSLVALHQTSGRGRMGRRWIDSTGEGVACSMTLPSSIPGERLALSMGIAVARAVESLGAKRVQIRWPNDIMARKRKLAGVLIERKQGMTVAGVGMNLAQTEWDHGLEEIAISLAQLGLAVEKLDAIIAIYRAIHEVFGWDVEKLENEFRKRDALKGRVCVFRCGTKEVVGRVKRIDPLRGLIVDEPTPMPGENVDSGKRQLFLPSMTTSLLRIKGPSRNRGPNRENAGPATT